jgi:hypothetical protein
VTKEGASKIETRIHYYKKFKKFKGGFVDFNAGETPGFLEAFVDS